ncbi:MAG: hypothetical protein WBN14_20605, partial [Polyangiales bacterium]
MFQTASERTIDFESSAVAPELVTTRLGEIGEPARMRWLPLLAALVLTAGCSGSKCKPCKDLEITTRNAANQQQWMRYKNARYRVLDTDPLTIAWEYM